MEDLQRAAKAYYDAAPDNVKQMAWDFITEMDHNSDGSLCLSEFLYFTRIKGYVRMSNPQFFNQLNMSRTGKLSFDEAITFFYIVVTARPVCDGCGCLMLGIFFTCVKCFNDAGEAAPFNLCTDCFRHHKYVHPHNHFLDNFVLLEAKRREAGEERHKFQARPTNAYTSTSLAIVPFNSGRPKFRQFCMANVEYAVGLGNKFCSII